MDLRAIWLRAEEIFAKRTAGLPRSDLITWHHVRQDGGIFDVSIAFQDIALDGRDAVVLHVTDVSERAFSVALLEAHGELLEIIARGTPLDQALEGLVLAMERLAPGMIGSALLLGEGRIRCGAAPHLPASYWKAIDGMAIGPESGSCGTAMYRAEAVIVTDIATDPLWKDFRDLALRHGLRACWSAPIFSRRDTVLGAFALYYREPRAPNGRELRVVHAAAQLASIAIERRNLDRAMAESEARLRAIIDNAPLAIYVKDLAGRHVVVNRFFEQVARQPAEAMHGKTDAELFPRDFSDALARNDRRVVESRAPMSMEEELILPDGRRVYLSVKFPLLDAAGVPYAVCGISADITERKSAQRALESSREELRALSRQLQNVREEEQARISREVHDELGQLLAGLSMNQALMLRELRAGAVPPALVIARLESMEELVQSLRASVRRIATELRPEVLDALGIAAALEWQAAEFERRNAIACDLRLPKDRIALDSQRSTALFRIFQEALNNVAKHSRASGVTAELRRERDAVQLVVADNGCGLVQERERDRPSLGVVGMRERAAMLGGELSLAGVPGGGAVLTVRLPL